MKFEFSPRMNLNPLVVRSEQLFKARTKGAVGGQVKGGKYGKIVFLRDGKERYLEAKHNRSEVLRYYDEKSIPYLFIEPGKMQTRKNVDEKIEEAKRRAVTLVIPKEPTPIIDEVKLDQSKTVSGVAALRKRVANWKRPDKFQHAIDPKHKMELQELLRKRRTHASANKRLIGEMAALKEFKPKGWKGMYRDLATQRESAVLTFQQTGNRIKHIMGASHPTKGGGFSEIGDDYAGIGSLPHAGDLGFNPTKKPMSYLLSLGWDTKKDTKVGTVNVFTNKEFGALAYEYEGFISRTVAGYVRRYLAASGQGEFKEGSNQRSSAFKKNFRKWRDTARDEVLYEMAAGYKARGEPSESNNFALFVHTFLPRKLSDIIRKDDNIGKRAKHEMFDFGAEEADDVETKRKLVRQMSQRVETPEQALYRKELETSVRTTLLEKLTPIEAAVVAARLNFGDERGGYTPTKASKKTTATENMVGVDLLSWASVRDRAKKELANDGVAKLSDATFASHFDRAMEQLRNASSDLDPTARRNLAELATLKRMYLETGRHKTWDGNEGFSKLIVKEELPKETKTGYTKRHLISDKAVRQFWDSAKGRDLAANLGIDVNVYVQPGVSATKLNEAHKVRAFSYYRLVRELREQTPAKLKRMATRQNAPPLEGKYRNLVLPVDHYRALIQHVLAEKATKATVRKSLVILDCVKAIELLHAECQLWALHNDALN